jgi:hypothetical protein
LTCASIVVVALIVIILVNGVLVKLWESGNIIRWIAEQPIGLHLPSLQRLILLILLFGVLQ